MVQDDFKWPDCNYILQEISFRCLLIFEHFSGNLHWNLNLVSFQPCVGTLSTYLALKQNLTIANLMSSVMAETGLVLGIWYLV